MARKHVHTPRQSSPGPAWEPSDGLCAALLTALAGIFFIPILSGTSFLWEDFLYAWYPYRQFAAVSMAAGNLPLWNPYTFNGMPFLADIQMQVFYLPLTALTALVHNGHLGVYWIELVNILHYPVAGIGMFYLAKSFRLRQIPALFAGLTFMLSGFMVTHAIHQVVITLVSWFPLILLGFRRSLVERSWRWPAITALVLGHSFFAGFPQLSLFFYYFLFAFFLLEFFTTFAPQEYFSRPALVMAFRAASIVALSIGVTLIQLLPTLEMTHLAVRAEISYEKSTEGSFAWMQLLTFLFPKYFGTAGATAYNYWGPGVYWYFWETCVYFGALPLVLTLLSVRMAKENKYVAFFLGYAVFAVLFALGGNFVVQKFFFNYVPGFSTFRNPARMTVFVAFGAALLSGFSLQSILFGAPSDRRKYLVGVIAIAGFSTAVWLLTITGALVSFFPFLAKPAVATLVSSSTGTSLLLILLSAGILWWLIKRPSAPVALAGVGLLFLDLLLFGGNHNASKTNPEEYFAKAESVLHFLKSEPGLFRVNSRNSVGMIMDRNQGMVDRIFQMEGYTPLVLQRTRPPVEDHLMFDLLNVRFRTITDDQSRGLRIALNPTALPRAFFAYRYAVATSDDSVTAVMQSAAFAHGALAVLEVDPHATITPPADTTQGRAEFVTYDINRIEVKASTPVAGILVFSEMYYPGWKATVDGAETPVYRCDYDLRAIVVPPGEHSVVMRFVPQSVINGAIGTGLTVVICFGLILVGLRREHVAPAPEKSAAS